MSATDGTGFFSLDAFLPFGPVTVLRLFLLPQCKFKFPAAISCGGCGVTALPRQTTI